MQNIRKYSFINEYDRPFLLQGERIKARLTKMKAREERVGKQVQLMCQILSAYSLTALSAAKNPLWATFMISSRPSSEASEMRL